MIILPYILKFVSTPIQKQGGVQNMVLHLFCVAVPSSLTKLRLESISVNFKLKISDVPSHACHSGLPRNILHTHSETQTNKSNRMTIAVQMRWKEVYLEVCRFCHSYVSSIFEGAVSPIPSIHDSLNRVRHSKFSKQNVTNMITCFSYDNCPIITSSPTCRRYPRISSVDEYGNFCGCIFYKHIFSLNKPKWK